MSLPNLIIIGAMKCGTTSMHNYLGRHPQIGMSANKELKFFSSDANWARGVDWYASQFPEDTDVRGETSPSYSARLSRPGVPSRMHSVVPNTRLLYMVRDPVERLISQWMQRTSLGHETRSLSEIVLDDRYIDPSEYWTQISMYLEYYDASQILVIATEDLAKERRATMRRVFEFLEVDSDFYHSSYDIVMHRSARKRRKTRTGRWIAKTTLARGVEALPRRFRWPARDLLYLPFSRVLDRPTLTDRERAALIERLREDTNRLREYAGRDFADWSV